MSEFIEDLPAMDPDSKARLEWVDLASPVNSELKTLILQSIESAVAMEGVQVMDVLITSEHSSALKLREYLLELAILRSLNKDQSYSQINVQSEQIQSDRRIKTVTTYPPLWFTSGKTTFITNGGLEITQNMIVLTRHQQASELQYNQARLVILREADALLKDFKRPPFPPIKSENSSPLG